MITKLVNNKGVTRYPCQTYIKYDQGSELLGRKFKIILIHQEGGIVDKP